MTTGGPTTFEPCGLCGDHLTCTRHRICRRVHGDLRYGSASGYSSEVFNTDEGQREALARMSMEQGKVENMRFIGTFSPPRAVSRPELGWECPRCGTIHAPFIPSCTCKRGAP